MYTEPTASLIMDLYTMDSFQFGVGVCVWMPCCSHGLHGYRYIDIYTTCKRIHVCEHTSESPRGYGEGSEKKNTRTLLYFQIQNI